MEAKPEETLDTIRVLHIDDEPDILMITRESLEAFDQGIHLHPCTDPENALKELEAKPFDCVVTDYQMGDFDSLGLAGTIHKRFDLPVLIYTGRGSEEVAEAAFEAGVDDYIRKEASPSHFQVLGKRIRAAVDKHKAERELWESEERFRSLFESTHEGVVVSGPDGRYISANPAAAKILGYDGPDEMLGLSAELFYANPEERIKHYDRLNAAGYVTDYEHQIKKRDGSLGYVSANVALHKSEDGKVLRTEVFFRDITERIEYERRLSELSKQVEKLLSVKSIDEIGDNIAEIAEEIFGYPSGNYGIVEDDSIVFKNRAFSPGKITKIPIDKPGYIASAVRLGETQYTPDIQQEDVDITRVVPPEVWDPRSILVIPAKVNEKVVGVLSLRSDKVDAFTERDRSLLETIAVNVAGAVKRIIGSDELRSSEEMLRESEARLSLFMGSATDGFSLLDSELNIVDINNARVKMTLSTRELLVGRNVRELYPFHDERLTHRVKTYTKILETGESVTFTDFIRHPSFGERHVMVRAFKVGDGLGLITTDITEIRKLEERLLESEVLYRELAERSIDIIYKVDMEGKLQYLSPSVESLTGHKPKELIGKPYIKFLSADQRSNVVDDIREAITGNQIQGYQTEITAKDGRKVSVEVNSSLILEDGKPAGFQGVIRDVTARKKVEDELRESEERYRNLVELSPDVIMTFDFKGFVTSVNLAIERLSGFSPDELVGKHFSKLGYFRLRDLPRITRIANSIIRGKIPPAIEFPYVHKDGTQKWAEAHAGYVYERGRRVGIQAIVMDITDRKIVEEELKERASSLEEMVERRSQELLEGEKLVTAGKIASMVGHDLRGPLSNIKNSLYLIERKPEYLPMLKEKIDNAIDYALDMLEELRFSTRTEAPQIIETSLESLISRAVNDIQMPPTIKVETNIEKGAGLVSLDPIQIRRVMDNLIRNAIEAMPEGGELRITAERGDDELVIGVADNGSGIPLDLIPDLFKAFTTTKSKGMGLGLTYCKRAVEAHGGSISVESEEEKGTRFTISIPQPNH